MGQRIKFLFPHKGLEVEAELQESVLGQRILNLLPLEARANIWGKEIYFPIPLRSDIIFPQEVVQAGDIGYWPDGACLCLFFGPTPASYNDKEIRPATPVEVVGKILGDINILEQISSGSEIKVVKA
ncbi:MAG: cyclophilin-like fold protein [Candidatus Caldatribacteriaceae bacterium]